MNSSKPTLISAIAAIVLGTLAVSSAVAPAAIAGSSPVKVAVNA